MLRLVAQVLTCGGHAARAYGMDRVSLRPSEAVASGRVTLLSRDGGAATLEALQQTNQVSRRMRSDDQVHVCLHHPNLENSCMFLRRHGTEEAAEKPGQPGIDERLAITRGPDDVTIDAIEHGGNLMRLARAAGPSSPSTPPASCCAEHPTSPRSAGPPRVSGRAPPRAP